MDRHDAYTILADTLAKYKALRFEELEGLVGKDSYERISSGSGEEYLIDIAVAWVDNRRDAIRVDASADSPEPFRLERIEEHLVVPKRAPQQSHTAPRHSADHGSPQPLAEPMSIPLSDETEARLLRAYGSDDLDEARRLLETDCSHNIAGWEMAGLDRIRAAAIKLSGGSISKLVDGIVLVQTDFRDALVAAGFGSDIHAHESWWPDWDAS